MKESSRNLLISNRLYHSEVRKSAMSNDERLLHKMEPFPDDSYYDVLPAKPGIDFYKWFVDSRASFDSMSINIPKTYFHSAGSYILSTNDQGSIILEECSNIKAFSVDIFQNKLKNSRHLPKPPVIQTESEREEKMSSYEKDIPIVILKSNNPQNRCKYSTQLLDFLSFKEKLATMNLTDNYLLQEFIYPSGKHAAFIRYIYYSNSSIPLRSPQAFIVSNKTSIFSYSSLEPRFMVTIDAISSHNIYKFVGGDFDILEGYAKMLIDFLARAYGYRIDTLVLDFVRDTIVFNKYWLVSVPSFILNEENYKFKASQLSLSRESIEKGLAEMKKEGTKTDHCSLCGFKFKKNEIDKKVTVRMALDVRIHMEKRGVTVFSQFKAYY